MARNRRNYRVSRLKNQEQPSQESAGFCLKTSDVSAWKGLALPPESAWSFKNFKNQETYLCFRVILRHSSPSPSVEGRFGRFSAGFGFLD